MSQPDALKTKWTNLLQPLVGRTIQSVRYLTDDEQAAQSWDNSTVVLQLDDGTLLWPSADDEGNGAGALFIQKGSKTQSLPDGGAPTI